MSIRIGKTSGLRGFVTSRQSIKRLVIFALAFILVLALGAMYRSQQADASSTVPLSGYATVLNTGEKIDFDISSGANATIDNYTRKMAGYGWSEDLGWVSFGDADNPNGAIRADESGKLSSSAKSLSAGVVAFDESGADVSVTDGDFTGYAWSEDLGWVDFSNAKAIGYDPDLTAPSNASGITLKKSSGGMVVEENGWTNTSGYFSWMPGTDNPNGSGVLGYCLYLGQNASADPKNDKGLLGDSLVDTEEACPYAVPEAYVDLTVGNKLATAMTTSEDPYYLKIKSIDSSKNVHSDGVTSFSFRYDSTPPNNPAFINAPSQFLASKNVTVYWPSSGDGAPTDDMSGVRGLQYKIGDGPWYGKNHTGSQDITDLLDNSGRYTTIDPEDYDHLQEGNNIISFRTYDQAGNISSNIITTVIKINTNAPSAPQNLSVTPASSNQNNFAFSWSTPSAFQGTAESLRYCYSVNTLPTQANCTQIAAGVTSLASGPYATQPGENTFYVVARDEAGNINYEDAASVKFTANTSAPGAPLSLDVADISIKASSNWRLAVLWSQPTAVGSGVAKYKVLRSTDGTNFSEVASVSSTTYIDSGLGQQVYYYKIQACDSANSCGAASGLVFRVPTGRFTEPAELVSSPSVNIKTRSATITWITDRESDSRIQFGISSNSYFAAESAKSDQVKTHSIELNNLQPDTTYYYKARWTDSDGNVGSSSEITFRTLPAPSVKNISVPRLNLESATVQLTSSRASAVKIYYGVSDGFGGVKQINTSLAESSYTIDLDGLADGTKYFYKVNTIDSEGNEYDSGRIDSFDTPARPKITGLQFQPVEGAPSSTLEVSWSTNVPASSSLSYTTNGQPTEEVSESQLVTEHSLVIENLLDDSAYTLTATSRDALGNLASSEAQTFQTALDTRPPEISNVRVETNIRGVGDQATGQMIVSWQTDEPSTSQVSYGKGSSGDQYAFSTSENNALVTEHTVVISDLNTSQAFHFKAVSRDKARNTGESDDRSAIIGQPSDSVIDIILSTLERIFGL